MDVPGLGMSSSSDYFPYVFYTINADVVTDLVKVSS